MAVRDHRSRLGLGRIDPSIRRAHINALRVGLDPGTQARHCELYRRKAGEFPDGRKSMDETQWWIIDIIGPAILLIVLIWLVMRRRSNSTSTTTEAGTREVYREE